jgi:NAD(P)-dependent dehydrogenase (short-subunit alcohol dehydrogenase family)
MTTDPCSLDVGIIKISSVGGKIGGPLMASYSAAKHHPSRGHPLRLELAGSGIGVCGIEPGFISTAMRGRLTRDTQPTLRSLPAEGRSRYGSSLECRRGYRAGRASSRPR